MSAPVPAGHGQNQLKEAGGQPLPFGSIADLQLLRRNSNQIQGVAVTTVAVAANQAPSVGSGSPEGAVTRSPGASYFDTATDVHYYKKTGTGNTGWQVVA